MRKAGRPSEIPPPLELMCLNALWSLKQGCVKDVQQVLGGTRPLAYTTVMTILDRLARRGLISRQKAGRAFIYAPLISRDSVRRQALKEFLDRYFESSADQLIRFLQGQIEIEPAAPAALMPSGLDPALL